MTSGDDAENLDRQLNSGIDVASRNISQFLQNGSLNEFTPAGIGTSYQHAEFSTSERDKPAQESENLIAELTHELLVDSTNAESSSDTADDDLIDNDSSNARLRVQSRSLLPTGLCYDIRMRFHCELEPSRSDYHPEDPRRIYYIYRALCEAGLVDDKMSIPPLANKLLHRIPARHATRSEVCLVHQQAHYEFMERSRDMTDSELLILSDVGNSIYLNQSTFVTALLSAGGAIETCLAVAKGEVRNAIAVIRPPGHHAEYHRSMGFCHFDNVSIAARVCQQELGQTCRKILILDWDVHHGNGIQQAFENDPNVLYISIHVHENGNFYPAGPYGDHTHCGLGRGLGKNINIPWPRQGMGDADYLFAFQQVVMPVAYEFDPDLVMIAAGFDAAVGDQLGGCFVTPPCYAHMTHMLMALADGKLVVCLEGGYNLKSISNSALAVTRTLMGETPERIPETIPTIIGAATVKKVALHQSAYWRCLYPKDSSPDFHLPLGSERLHDVIRAYQSKLLYDTHKMINLWIFREKISKSFENQVLATANYDCNVPLIVIFHDPPEVRGVPHPVTNKLELHNVWLTDVLKHYIAWAVGRGFGVIDVNIPKFLTDIDEDEGYFEEEKSRRALATEELAVYLWENYIECNDSNEIFFVGVGEAYDGVLHLLNTRNDESFLRISGVVNFIVENTLRPVSEQNVFHFQLSKWYYRNSMLFIAADHAVWHPDRPKKPSKRFGTLIKSTETGLNQMLMRHKDEVQNFLLQRIRDKTDESKIVVAGVADVAGVNAVSMAMEV